MSNEELELDLAEAVGADRGTSVQTLTLYIPDRDQNGVEIGDQRRWVLEAAQLLGAIGGGVTIEPPVEGGWYNQSAGRFVWERPVLMYTYVHPERFVSRLPDLRSFLHRLGRETRQGEVAFEFDGQFFRVRKFEES